MVEELQLDTARAFNGLRRSTGFAWQGEEEKINLSNDEIRRALLELDQPIWVIEDRKDWSRYGRKTRFGWGRAGRWSAWLRL